MINARDFDIDPSSWEVDVLHVGQSQNRLVKIRNFFSNPDKVREIGMQAELKSTIMGEVSSIPGYTGRIGGVDMKFFTNFRTPILERMAAPMTILHNPKLSIFTIQRYKPGTECRVMSMYPHVDWMHYACVLSLNTEEELAGTDSGTGFCRQIETGMEHTCSDINYRHLRARNMNESMTTLDPSTFDRKGWELYHIEPHQYNTLLIYEGNVWHIPYFNTDWKCDRLTFNGFLK